MVRERDIPAAVMEAVIVLIALGLAFIAGIAGWAVGHSTRHTTTPPASSISAAPIDPHVAAGAHDFVQFACAQCHGERGRGDVTPDVPALTAVARQLTPAQLHARALSMVGSAHSAQHGLRIRAQLLRMQAVRAARETGPHGDAHAVANASRRTRARGSVVAVEPNRDNSNTACRSGSCEALTRRFSQELDVTARATATA